MVNKICVLIAPSLPPVRLMVTWVTGVPFSLILYVALLKDKTPATASLSMRFNTAVVCVPNVAPLVGLDRVKLTVSVGS